MKLEKGGFIPNKNLQILLFTGHKSLLHQITEIAELSAFHERLIAGQLDFGTSNCRNIEVLSAAQKGTQLRLADLIEELRITTADDLNLSLSRLLTPWY